MGAQESKAQVLSRIVNETTTNVMSKISTSAEGSIQQSNTIKISGIRSSSITDINQANEAKISISAIGKAAQSGELQSQLSAALSQAIQQNSSAIGTSKSDTNIDTDVKNVIKANVTNESVNKAFAGVTQSNAMDISDIRDSSIQRISQTNIGTAIAQLMSESSNALATKLGIDVKTDTKTSQTTSNPVSDTIKAASDSIKAITSMVGQAVSGNMFIFVIIIAAIAFGGYMYQEKLIALWGAYYPTDLYVVIGLAAVLVVGNLL